jgi:hypothetical protein
MSNEFLNQKNENFLQRALYRDICRRVGGDLNEKQATRLIKTVKHYMGEVYRLNDNKTMGVSEMNKEVGVVVLQDYLTYMDRVKRGSASSVISDIEEGPGLQPQEAHPQVQARIEDIRVERTQIDIGTAFSKLQADRQQAKPKAPMPNDFRLSLQDEAPVDMNVFERMKQERESEALRANIAAQTQQSIVSASSGQLAFAEATDVFSRDRRRMESEAEAAFAERERSRLEARAAAGSMPYTTPRPLPDMRALILGDSQTLQRSQGQVPNAAAGNPTAALPIAPREVSGGLSQLLLPKEPEKMTYKENELNLFVYSADRDWISNSTETRYNFTVTFDPANMPVGLRLSPTSTVKFRNIVRVELVKAIMPGESLDSFVTRTYNGSAFSYSAPYNMNVLSLPYVQVRVPELDNNNYGTNQSLNASFGVLQYDANWIYDTSNSAARGYFAMIPKFLKCQKIYSPTPLSTLQKLSFRFERPDGTLLSTVPDTLDIAQIYSSKEVAASTGFPYGYDSSVENNTGAAYYFLKTTTYFNTQTVVKGERIVMKNIAWSTAPTANNLRQATDLLSYLQQDAGLIVVDTGYGTSATAGITLGANKQGYCNFIIVRGIFADPTTGSTVTSTVGGIADAGVPGTLSTALTFFLNGTTVSTGRLLNLTHQVQVTLRVITREMDATGFLRPDNL